MPEYDCTRCGACCQSVTSGFYVAVTQPDLDRLKEAGRRRAATPIPEQFWAANIVEAGEVAAMRTRPLVLGNRCAHLRGRVGAGVTCSVYAARPETCRVFEPGSDLCLAARRESGVR